MSAIKYRTSIDIQISRFRTMALCLDSPSVLGLKPSVSQYTLFHTKTKQQVDEGVCRPLSFSRPMVLACPMWTTIISLLR